MQKIAVIFLIILQCLQVAAWTIIVPEKAEPSTMYAAEELQEFLEKSLKRSIKICRETENVSGRKIYVGSTLFARSSGVDTAKYGKEESLIKKLGEHLLICGGAPRGTLYGVYEFLERFVSVSWLDWQTTIIPQYKELPLPEKISLRFTPSFSRRGIFVLNASTRGGQFFEQNLNFRSRMRENVFWQENISEKEKAVRGIDTVFGRPAPLNTLYYYIREWPREGVEKSLSLDKSGKRLRPVGFYGPGHVCFSDSGARKRFSEQLKGYIARDRKENPGSFPAFYNLSINDTANGYCVCKGCTALTKKYGAHSGAMLDFVNHVAKEAAKIYPDIKIQTSAYLFTEKPPVGIKPLKNVYVRMSPIDTLLGGRTQTMLSIEHPANKQVKEMIQKWSRLGTIHIWNYWVNFGRYYSNACIVNVETICKNLQFYKKHGADYIFSECEFPDTASFHPLRVYVGYQMQRDISQQPDALLDKFFNGYYGPAAKTMRKLYDYICTRQKEHANLSVRGVEQLNYADRDFFRNSERFLAEAEKLAGTDKNLLLHIAFERIPLDCARLALRDNWSPEKNLPPRQAVLNRLTENWPRSIRYWHGENKISRAELRTIRTRLAEFADLKFGAKYPLPDGMDKRRVIEITSEKFRVLPELVKYSLKLVDDKDSCTGKALKLGKHPLKNAHARRFECGIRSRFLKKDLLKFSKPVKKDEKYHLYHLGRFTATPQTLLWLHWTWAMQHDLSPVYRQGKENTYDIYVSLKFCGPAYSPESKQENAFFMDRILLVLSSNQQVKK